MPVENKNQWPEGPWTNEPDEDEFTTAVGLPARIRRHKHSGSLCGYVQIPVDHPLYGKSYSDTIEVPESVKARVINAPRPNVPAIPLFIQALQGTDNGYRVDLLIDVHGGLTWAGTLPWEEVPKDPLADEWEWWFGFDCTHTGDVCPGFMKNSVFFSHGIYRELSFVKDECEKLAKQIVEWPR